MTTITDICSGKADLDKCAAGTLYKIAKVFGATVDFILENNSAEKALANAIPEFMRFNIVENEVRNVC